MAAGTGTAAPTAVQIFERARREMIAATPDGTGGAFAALVQERAALALGRCDFTVTPERQRNAAATAALGAELERLRAAGVDTAALEAAIKERLTALPLAVIADMALAAGELLAGPSATLPLASPAEA